MREDSYVAKRQPKIFRFDLDLSKQHVDEPEVDGEVRVAGERSALKCSLVIVQSGERIFL